MENKTFACALSYDCCDCEHETEDIYSCTLANVCDGCCSDCSHDECEHYEK